MIVQDTSKPGYGLATKAGVAVTTMSQVSVSPTVAAPPFVIGANGADQLVDGLNADMLDGVEGTSYTLDTEWDSLAEIEAATGYDFSDAGNLDTGTLPDDRLSTDVTRDGEWDTRDEVEAIWPGVTTIWCDDNDGTGSGLDADLLDGQHGAYYMPAATDNWVDVTGDTMSGQLVNNHSIQVDNMLMDGNTWSATDTNGNLIIDPPGTGKIGFNTTAPGVAFTYSGTSASTTAGPFMRCMFAGDSYPLWEMFNYNHDAWQLVIDAYYSGGHKSSDAGSNFRLIKLSDQFKIGYSAGNAQGAAVTYSDGLIVDSTGYVNIATGPLKVAGTERVAADGDASFVDLSATGNVTLGDAAGDAVTINGTVPSLSVSSSATTPLTVASTDAGAGLTYIDLYRNSASPAGSDVMHGINFTGNNSAAKMTYASIQPVIVSATSPITQGRLDVYADTLGTLGRVASFDGSTGVNIITGGLATNGTTRVSSSGIYYSGANDSVSGGITVYGGSSTAAGYLSLYPGADLDATYNYWQMKPSTSLQGRLNVGPDTDLDMFSLDAADTSVRTPKIRLNSGTIKFALQKTGLVDNTATAVAAITTTDESGSADGGCYSVHISGVGASCAAPSDGVTASRAFEAMFSNATPGGGTGNTSAVTQTLAASISTNAATVDINNIVLSATNPGSREVRINITVDLTGTTFTTASAAMEITINWVGFTTEPQIAAL